MPFGLTSSPSTFERLMELLLAGLRFETCLIYLDDTIVYGKTFLEELERLEEAFVRFESAGLKLKPGKCVLFQKSWFPSLCIDLEYLVNCTVTKGPTLSPKSLLDIEKNRTSPLHPQSDGQVQRYNRTLIEILRGKLQENQEDWDLQLQTCMMAYRSSVSE